jgi:hypothetical protein
MEVGARRAENGGLEGRPALVEVVDRIGIEAAAVSLDRAPHRRGMRRQEQPAHVRPAWRQAKLPTYSGPVQSDVRFGGRDHLVEVGERRTETARGKSRAGPDEKLSAIEHQGSLAILLTPHFTVSEKWARGAHFL